MSKLYVEHKNTKEHVRQRDLEELFGKYGPIRNIQMKYGFSFIIFDDKRDAEEAVKSLDRTRWLGGRLLVDFAFTQGELPNFSHRRPGEGRCFKCGIEGHWARECPHEDGDDTGDVPQGDHEDTGAHAPPLHEEVLQMWNRGVTGPENVPTKMVIDTGDVPQGGGHTGSNFSFCFVMVIIGYYGMHLSVNDIYLSIKITKTQALTLLLSTKKKVLQITLTTKTVPFSQKKTFPFTFLPKKKELLPFPSSRGQAQKVIKGTFPVSFPQEKTYSLTKKTYSLAFPQKKRFLPFSAKTLFFS
eukprot:CAMPEP_0174275118 /NCGR_PEP_ID=MMETSP0439-20130205/59654_1 /TAXON_ID=0 /ORGANISM="Stereomyxa ramosa, Strain Chinc5" /LENGTH=298 /DNA_ID=CAMNT_0015367197 /DNA_START=24 /DNA_END=921 /DNA_ORIENTATION=-